MSKSNCVGVVGLGRMGTPVALTLKRAGFNVIATSRSLVGRGGLSEAGVDLVETPSIVARSANVVLVSVFDTKALQEVVLGDNGLLGSFERGGIIIDIGTSEIAATVDLAKALDQVGCHYIDAPVSGGTRGAREGQLTIMAGAEDQALEVARPVLSALGRVNHMGPVGAGQSTKAVNQLILGETLVAVAEGLSLAKQLKISPDRVREALMGGFADSRVLNEHGKRMAERNYTPGGSISVFSKDLRMVSALTKELGMHLDGLQNAKEQYETALAKGMGDLDQSAVFALFE